MELHLHKLQVSARVISRGCDAHNRRFATVSCEAVTLGNDSHAHQVTFRADSCEGHVHYLEGIASLPMLQGNGQYRIPH